MTDKTKPAVPDKEGTTQPVTPEWEKALYAPERLEKWIRGEITLQELNALSGPDMLEMAVIGHNMFSQGRYEEAKVIFQGLCTLDPKESYYRTALGVVLFKQENLDGALRMFNAALALNDKDIDAYGNRGELYLRQGKILEAAHDLKSAVDLDPENKHPVAQRARLHAAAVVEIMEEEARRAHNANVASSSQAIPSKAPAIASKPAPAKKK